MQPRSIKKINPRELLIIWDTGHQSQFTIEELRNICPCAGCHGEDILLHHHPPAQQDNHPQKYQLVGVDPVGSYAVQLRWGDGHNGGIYTWEHIMGHCPCDQCRKNNQKPS